MGMEAVICVDLMTFAAAFLALLAGVRLPSAKPGEAGGKESFGQSVRSGLHYLREQKMILTLILFLAGVNFVASAFDAALPAMVLSRENGGETVLGLVSSCAGVATLLGSVAAALLPPPKKPHPRHLPDDALLPRDGKLPAGALPGTGLVVRGAAGRLAAGAADER